MRLNEKPLKIPKHFQRYIYLINFLCLKSRNCQQSDKFKILLKSYFKLTRLTKFAENVRGGSFSSFFSDDGS